MTQTSPTPGSATPRDGVVFPPGRYGRRREPVRRRWVLPLALVAVIALTGLVALKLYTQYGTQQFSPTVLSLTNVTNSTVTVTFRVAKPEGPAVCTINAEARDGTILGTSDVPVPAGSVVTVTHTVTTSGRPYIAEVPACRAAG
ncbi:MAG TPA: DUF4307 domain-containing protein [Micromonosporaceae bacterium]|nr:DUF4307 domain-containing protein [Micromonosporaceae bacterium]